MSHDVPTIKVKPWSADQGDYVVINESDFDAAVHERFEEKKSRGKKSADAGEQSA